MLYGIHRSILRSLGRGILKERDSTTSNIAVGSSCRRKVAMLTSGSTNGSKFKKRKISISNDYPSSPCSSEIEASLPVLHSSDYFMEPSLEELAASELANPGHCSCVQDFTVGRIGYGYVKFLGKTDVRSLDLNQIVKFERHGVVVYENETDKPAVGQGLNKAAEVTLILETRFSAFEDGQRDFVIKKLRNITERQGATLISYDLMSGEWKFLVYHFSRFGLSEDDEDDIVMDAPVVIQNPKELDENEVSDIDAEFQVGSDGTSLSHSLPAHLGLDPVKMQEMRKLMFVAEEEEIKDFGGLVSHDKWSFSKENRRPALQYSAQKDSHKTNTSVVRRTPQALLEYNVNNYDLSPQGNILMTRQNKGKPPRTTKVEGFKLDLKYETPILGSHSANIIDAGLFLGRSFRVGWGPNGVLVHTGAPVGNTDPSFGISSIINVERVAIDKLIIDANYEVKEELVNLGFSSPLSFHKSINHETTEVEVGSFKLKLQKLVSNRVTLSDICRGYINIVEKQLDVHGLSTGVRIVLMHQIMVWELIKVLFSEREIGGKLISLNADDEEDTIHDRKGGSSDIDPEALPFVRRAEFSYWLQESVCHRVQEEVSYLSEYSDLIKMFLLMTGRQLDAAVELAVDRGDVRLACLLSQAGASTVNRSDVAQQLELWRINGLDFNFIEEDRIRLYELLAGNIHGALHNLGIDWKRFLGLLIWYQQPPDTPLPIIFHTYQQLLDEGRAPYPVPVYIDEGPPDVNGNWSSGDRFDIAYYLMLLHANGEKEFGFLKSMFSAFSSTHDPLDYHMIWHQRAVLEAVGAFSSNDLHILDMGLVSQLLCLGQCHWAIYVVLHMPYNDDFPYLQANVIREILFQYCESWSAQEEQCQFIKDLGIPSSWLHEAMGVYLQYYGDLSKALEHFIECSNWQRAHSIFMTVVAHSLFLSGAVVFLDKGTEGGYEITIADALDEHQVVNIIPPGPELLVSEGEYIKLDQPLTSNPNVGGFDKHSEIWKLATFMEEHKAEIADWDVGAGVYISFYLLKGSFLEESEMNDLDSLERKNAACRDFFDCLNESLSVWGSELPVDARVTYSKMAEEICGLLLSDNGEVSSREVQLRCFDTMDSAPIPEDLRSSHLQDAVSVFTCFLSEAASS